MKIGQKHFLIFMVASIAIAIFYFTGIGCPIRSLTGIPCPTCGLTRSVVELLRLNIPSSFRYFPMTVPLFFVIFLAFHKKLFPKHKILINVIITVIAILIFIVYIIRMITGIII